MEELQDFQLPIIDLANSDKISISHQIIAASQEYGFFKIINHGVPHHTVTRMDQEARKFFAKPVSDKRRAAGPAKPYGYGCNTIGPNGDTGQLEYLLLQPNSNADSDDISPFVDSNENPADTFRGAVKGYVEAVKELACEILDYMETGLLLGLGYRLESSSDMKVKMKMSGLLKDPENDSVFRLNHYPCNSLIMSSSDSKYNNNGNDNDNNVLIGFGEHTDPQMLTILRSNAVEGLQISLQDGVWLPVNPHPLSAFCVNIGDALQVMSNGRFKSVKHRAIVVNKSSSSSFDESRLSMAYFCAPALQATVGCYPWIHDQGMEESGIITSSSISTTSSPPPLYRNFTWAEYKAATYACRLGDDRLHKFRLDNNNSNVDYAHHHLYLHDDDYDDDDDDGANRKDLTY